MIKRISLLVTAALLVATMAMAGLSGPAFAGTDSEPINGGHTASCQGQCGADDKDAVITNKNGKVNTGGGLQKKADQIKPGNSG